MIRRCLSQGTRPAPQTAHKARRGDGLLSWCAVGLLVAGSLAAAQVVTVDSHTGTVTNGAANGSAPVDRRYQQITPTHVPLTNSELDAKTRLELIRLLQAEQGFAMRPFPRGHKGLTLIANGKLNPAGEAYLSLVISQGVSANAGDRLVLTDIKIDHSRIIFDLNGGPDKKHGFLNHVQIGVGPSMHPVVPQDDKEPVGARLSLVFDGHIPELTGAEVKALLGPMISFDVKTPIQAFTDTLPAQLKAAILDHHVLVGMSTDMLLYAKGPPEHKSREMEGQTPFEEWIYGRPPEEVDFVRINGNRVIRVEVAKNGATPVIFTKDEVDGLMRTDGTPVEVAKSGTRTVEAGDAERDPNTQAPTAPPSLRNPGEELPNDKNTGVMKPVRFPKAKPAPQPGANPDGEDDAQPATPEQSASTDAPKSAQETAQPSPQNASEPAAAKPFLSAASQPQ